MNRMNTERKSSPELNFVSRDPDMGALLRLMVVNPINDTVCTMINTAIETDPPLYMPGPDDLPIDDRPQPDTP